MDDIDQTESLLQDQDKNEFLDADFQYQNCPHCQRNFFFGKLKYHLKLCKPNNPMTKSPLKKTKRSYISTPLEKSQPEIDQLEIHSPTSFRSPEKYKKCLYCKATYPLTMLERHIEKCNLKPSQQTNPEDLKQDLNKLKSKTKIDFGIKKDLKQPSSALPRIRNSARQHKNIDRKFVSQEPKDLKSQYTVRIREDLSCFKKALEVQQIECHYCHRKFSKEASLRHIPICQKIKLQEMHQIALKKHSKSQIYKLSVPIKKSTLFRSKFLSNLTQKNDELEIKSARVYELQKVERQKNSNSSLIAKKQNKKERRLSDLKPLMTKDVELIQSQFRQSKSDLKNNLRQVSSLEMNMTFSKNFNNEKKKSSITVDVFSTLNNHASLRLPTFEKEQEATVFQEGAAFPNSQQTSTFTKKQTQELENEFLQVTASKKSFFADIVIECNQRKFDKEKQENKTKDEVQMKFEIGLKDKAKGRETMHLEEDQNYQLEFDEE